jgi:glucokinase
MKDDNSIAIGIDIGGSHISAGIVDLSAKTLLKDSIVRQPVNSGGAAMDIIKSWADVIRHIMQQYDLRSAKTGIAMPGPFNYEEGISLMKENKKFGSLYGMNIRKALAREAGIQADMIQFRNDAEAFLEGEMFCGLGQGCSTVAAITLGTGLGSAWHRQGNTVDADLWNSPFLDSTAESYLSTRWFISRYKDIAGVELPDVKSISAVAGSDPKARQVFDEFGKNLSAFINELISKENPEVIVLGGNIIRGYHLFQQELMKGLGEANSQKVKLSGLGELAALVGGACLWNESKVAV